MAEKAFGADLQNQMSRSLPSTRKTVKAPRWAADGRPGHDKRVQVGVFGDGVRLTVVGANLQDEKLDPQATWHYLSRQGCVSTSESRLSSTSPPCTRHSTTCFTMSSFLDIRIVTVRQGRGVLTCVIATTTLGVMYIEYFSMWRGDGHVRDDPRKHPRLEFMSCPCSDTTPPESPSNWTTTATWRRPDCRPKVASIFLESHRVDRPLQARRHLPRFLCLYPFRTFSSPPRFFSSCFPSHHDNRTPDEAATDANLRPHRTASLLSLFFSLRTPGLAAVI